MNQPLSRWGSGTPASPTDAAVVGGLASVGERHVLLRIPDCSIEQRQSAAETGACVLMPVAWLALLTTAARELLRPWRRPRTLLAGALGVALVLGVVALWASGRRHGTPHAGSDHRPERMLDAPPEVEANPTYVARARSSVAGTSPSSVLETAPPFAPGSEVNQAKPNRSGTVEGPRLTPPRAAAGDRTDDKPPPVERARLGKQLERVRAQYP